MPGNKNLYLKFIKMGYFIKLSFLDNCYSEILFYQNIIKS